ncbi:hypothetical protein SALBM135S_00557 [Streptomyces alboniger]
MARDRALRLEGLRRPCPHPAHRGRAQAGPALWQRAKAGSGHCRVVYQAETAEEITVASSLGFVPYQVGRPHRPAFLPVRLVDLLGR